MTISEKNNQLGNWVNKNRTLLYDFKDQWIAYNLKGIIANGKELHEVCEKADNSGEEYVLYYVSKYLGEVRFFPIRFHTFSTHYWKPTYKIKLTGIDKELELDMLIDSGADCSLVTKRIGEKLGFQLAKAETLSTAPGIGGRVKYVMRDIKMLIDNHSIKAPVAWIQEEDCPDIILGREVVFDLFDIEFKQAEEKIIFKRRKKVII